MVERLWAGVHSIFAENFKHFTNILQLLSSDYCHLLLPLSNGHSTLACICLYFQMCLLATSTSQLYISYIYIHVVMLTFTITYFILFPSCNAVFQAVTIGFSSSQGLRRGCFGRGRWARWAGSWAVGCFYVYRASAIGNTRFLFGANSLLSRVFTWIVSMKVRRALKYFGRTYQKLSEYVQTVAVTR